MEIKAAKYFEGFETKTQKEQLEFVNDSRKQIEELIGEVKFVLKEKGNSVPDETRKILEVRIQELGSENLFTRLDGLRDLLSSLLLLELDNQTITEFTNRNYLFIKEYLDKLMNVEVNAITRTIEERQELEDNFRDSEFGLSHLAERFPEISGLGAFIEYDKLIVECINKIARNERKGFFSEDYSFREDEIQNPDKWLARVRRSADAAKWLLTFDMLISFIRDIHDNRVMAARAEKLKKSHTD